MSLVLMELEVELDLMDLQVLEVYVVTLEQEELM